LINFEKQIKEMRKRFEEK